MRTPDRLETWGTAATVGAPNGLHVGGPGALLYQTSVAERAISVVDPYTGAVLDRIGPERGVHGPDDVFVTDDGTLYWTDFFVGRVGRLSPDGTWRVQPGVAGPNPITVHGGRVFTASTLFGTGLYELDPDLVDPPRLLLGDLENPNAFAFGADGLLYVPMMFQGLVVRVDVGSHRATVVDTVADGFDMPTSVKLDHQGRLVVTEHAGGRTTRVDLATGRREVLLDIEGVLDNSAIGPDGTIYSAAQADGTIWAIAPSGARRHLTPPGLVAPSGVAVDRDGSLLVADWFSIRRFRDGSVVWSVYNRLGTPMAHANTVAVVGSDVVTTGMMRRTVQVIDGVTGEVRRDVRDLDTPTNAIGHASGIVVAQAGARDRPGTGSVVRLDDRGVLIDGLDLPTGLASDGTTLFVADWATGTLWAVGPNGRTVVAAGLSRPEGLAVTGGRVLVVEAGIGQVTAIDVATRERRAVAQLPFGREYTPGLLLPYGQIAGVAVEPDGSFWVASDVERVVARFPAMDHHGSTGASA